MIAHRTFNLTEGFLGVPGTGKSTLAVRRCIELSKLPAYVLIHDKGFNVPDTLPDGSPTGCIRHTSIAALKATIANDARGLHCYGGDARELIAYARQLAAASLRHGGGKQGVPVIIYIDEVVAALDLTPHKFAHAEMKELLFMRRHEHIGILWSTQSPGNVHYSMIDNSTEIHLFRIIGRGHLRLREASVPEEIIEVLDTLPDHHHVDYKIGSIVSEKESGNLHEDDTEEEDKTSPEDTESEGSPIPPTDDNPQVH